MTKVKAVKRQWSVRTFLLLLVLACLLPGVIGATTLFIFQYQESRSQLQKNTILTARALMQVVDHHLLRVQAVAQTLATADALQRHDFSKFHARAREAMADVGLGNNVVLRDSAGRQILNTAVDFGKPLKAAAAPEQVRAIFATGKPVINDMFFGPVMKRPVMSVEVPVFIDGEIAYALGVGILPEHFNSILHSQRLPPDWLVAIVDSAGTIVGRSHSPERFINQKAAPQFLEALKKTAEGEIEVTSVEGVPILSFFSESPVTRWRVAIGIPRHTVEGAFATTLSILAIGVASLFGIGLYLAWFMGGKIAYSVRALTGPASALGNGETVQVPTVPLKEAAEVASAIGRAARLLHEHAASLDAKESELAEAHRLAKFGTWYWDARTDAITASDSVPAILGAEVRSLAQIRGTLLSEKSWQMVNEATQNAIATGTGYDLEVNINRPDGSIICINTKCQAVLNDRHEAVGLRGTVQDITERKKADERLREAALHDPLTALPNRALVFEYCGRLLAAARRNHSHGALLFIDLDRFKPVNDLYGHETGDRLLQEVASRLADCVRDEDLVGRIGGDEFVVVLPYIETERERVALVAQHVCDSLEQPFRIDGLELTISASIGISYFPDHATEVSTLLHTADLAMYLAKQSGRANYQFYTPGLEERAEQTLILEVRLKQALKQGTLKLHYQPVIDIRSGKLAGAEALVRLADEHGVESVGPATFIPVAESTGLIGELGEWALQEACRQQMAWRREGLETRVAINVSPLQFRQRAFVERLSEIIASSGIDPSCLEIEVTESAVMENVGDAIELLRKIKMLGVKVALDDFGTGYSSLSSLSNLPLDKLKVDQSFVRRLERDKASRSVTEAIIALARSLNLQVVGEGIESEFALHYLGRQGCNLAQGYWFSRPLPPDEFLAWYRSRTEDRRMPLAGQGHG